MLSPETNTRNREANSTSILKFEATVIRPKDDDELDGLATSISFPVEYDDEVIGEALGDQDLMAYVVGELHDLVVRMRPEWLDNEDTSLTIKAFLDDAEYQTFKGPKGKPAAKMAA